jgi:hypothetical protein
MTRILLVGYDPDAVDFSDPGLPPGMTAEKIRAGIAAALKQFTARGWEADVGFIRPDETAGPTVERLLAATSYDCVVIGAGVHLPPRRVAVFEAVINAVYVVRDFRTIGAREQVTLPARWRGHAALSLNVTETHAAKRRSRRSNRSTTAAAGATSRTARPCGWASTPARWKQSARRV